MAIIHAILKNVTCTRMELVPLFMDHQLFKEAYQRLPNKAENMAEFEKGLNEKPYVVDQTHIDELGVFTFAKKKYVILNQRPSGPRTVHGQFKVRLIRDGGKGKGNCVSTLCVTLHEVEKLERERGITPQKKSPESPPSEEPTPEQEFVTVEDFKEQWVRKTPHRSDLRRITEWLIAYCCPNDQKKKRRYLRNPSKKSYRFAIPKSVMVDRLLSVFPNQKGTITADSSESEIIDRINQQLIEDSKNGGEFIRSLASEFYIAIVDPSNITQSIPFRHNPVPYREGKSSSEQGYWLRRR